MLHVPAHLAGTSSAESAAPHSPIARHLGFAFLLLALGLIFVRVLAFETALEAAAQLLSADGEIAPRRRALMGTILVEAAFCSALLALLLFVSSTANGRSTLRSSLIDDPLKRSDNRLPNGQTVMLVSSIMGVALIALWLIRLGTPYKLEILFAKEGPLELITFLALVGSAAMCLTAAYSHLRRHKTSLSRSIALCYGVLGGALFVIGMEEISWGQTYLRWQTPDSWAAINSQRETTVHNLLDQPTLHVVEQRIIFAFVALALVGMYLAIRGLHPFVTALAPHFSTAPILILIAYSAFHFHLEMPEILFSIFIVCYAWRVYRSAKTIGDGVTR